MLHVSGFKTSFSTAFTCKLFSYCPTGPSGADAHCWRRLCTTFHSGCVLLWLCLPNAFVPLLCLLTFLFPLYLACRLIAWDKKPVVRPIGVCARQMAGVEAAVHSVRKLFASDDCDTVLLVDTSDAFNSLNRIVALHNVRQLCPPFAPISINIYRSQPVYLFQEMFCCLKKEPLKETHWLCPFMLWLPFLYCSICP